MIWLRVVLLVAVIGAAALAITQAIGSPPQAAPATAATPEPTSLKPLEPTPRATRVPLPTLGPQMIISRTVRETPTPGPTPTPSSEPRVSVVDNGYAPAALTIKPGTSVLWVNSGGDGHDVVGRGPDDGWRSGPLAPGERYARSFFIPGTYEYVCSVHPEMRGRILVQP